jgi:hypothetical protein
MLIVSKARKIWLGLSFHESVIALPQFTRALAAYPSYIVRALVPLRRSERIPFCINWADEQQLKATSFSTRKGLADCCRRARKSCRGNAEEMSKLRLRIKHTSAFLKSYGPKKEKRL